MNCLSYALRFWNKYPHYIIMYNSDHCINVLETTVVSGFSRIEVYGFDYFYKWYTQGLITKGDVKLLRQYFNV